MKNSQFKTETAVWLNAQLESRQALKLPSDEVLPDSFLNLLPTSVKYMAEVIGVASALKIVEYYKGTYLSVPNHFDDSHPLVKILGHEAAAKVVFNYSGELIEIPKCEKAMLALRNQLIKQSNKTQQRLALEYNLSVRQVRNIQHGLPDEDLQDSLF